MEYFPFEKRRIKQKEKDVHMVCIDSVFKQ